MAARLGSLSGKVAVVTGAASGIGRATARLLAERGARLALADQRPLGEAAGMVRALTRERVIDVTVDVSDAGAVETLRYRVETELGVADLIVNAAGTCVVGGFFETGAEDWQYAFDVNLRGPVLLCRALLPAMIARGAGGYVVNVASASAFFTPKELVAYGAAKHALVGLSQALREELAPNRIGVSVVCPGFVATNIAEHARFVGHDVARRRDDARDLLRRRGLSAERVARAIVRAAERGSGLVPVGLDAWFLRVLEGVSPGSAARIAGLVRGASEGR